MLLMKTIIFLFIRMRQGTLPAAFLPPRPDNINKTDHRVREFRNNFHCHFVHQLAEIGICFSENTWLKCTKSGFLLLAKFML